METPNNGVGLTGLAYGATIIPVKVLNRYGDGDEDSIAKGIRYAADQGAQVINLSFEFGTSTSAADQIPLIAAAVRYARRKGALIVAAAGNTRLQPRRLPRGAAGRRQRRRVTEHGCLADYSTTGPGLDLVAPGGGADATLPGTPVPGRRAAARSSSSRSPATSGRFGYPTDYYGTSMAAPARLGHGGTDHRLRRARQAPDAGPDRGAPEDHRARPRRARATTRSTATA